MAQAVKYKRPRKINVVSVTIGLVVAFIVYMGYQYVPDYLLKQETYRVLEETASHFYSRRVRYLTDRELLQQLKNRMHSQLVVMGVDDPDAESWIEVDEHEVRFGIVYSKWVKWPFDIIEEQEKVYEIEHTVAVKDAAKTGG